MVIVDAGGGTVDLSSYSRNKENFKEIAAPQCSFVFVALKMLTSAHSIPGHFHGSVFVTFHARRFLESMSLPN